MKKIIFFSLLAFAVNAKAQITLEHTYDSASVWNWCAGKDGQLMIINFEVSGEHYVNVNTCGGKIEIYNMNHTLYKTISLANVPLEAPYNTYGPILYLSEKLFNTDPLIEFMYIHEFTDINGNGNFLTNIYNENGTLLFTDTSAAWIKTNFEQQQLPIYNTAFGTKMILSCANGKARVFGLPGTLTTGISNGNQLLMQSNFLSNPSPNPTNSSTRIDYTFPDGVDNGEIVFYDLSGKEVKRFKVDKTFSSLDLSTSDLNAGTYLYQLQTANQNSAGKKMVVIK